MKPVCREFFKGGALSIDKLIEERTPPVEERAPREETSLEARTLLPY